MVAVAALGATGRWWPAHWTGAGAGPGSARWRRRSGRAFRLSGDLGEFARGALLALLGLDDRLVLGFVQRVDLGGAVGALDLDVLHADVGGFTAAALGLVLPPEEADDAEDQQDGEADEAQDALRQAHGLLDATQAVDVAASGVGAGIEVEVGHQARLVHAQQLGVGTDVAPGEGVAGQLVERARFELAQGLFGQVQLSRDLGKAQVLAFTRLPQGLAWVGTGRRGNFGLRRFHLCSDRYCWYSGVPG